jgi:hypothetical protein
MRDERRGGRTTAAMALCLAILPAVDWAAEAEVLTWPGVEKDPHPCLYVTAKDVARAKAARKDIPQLAALKTFNLDGNLEQAIAAALVAENPEAEKAVIAGAGPALDNLLKAIPSTTIGNKGPHAYSKPFGMAVALADAALAAKSLTPAQRTEIAGKVAKLCYAVNDPMYYSPECPHGSLCPNMFTSAALYRLGLAALIPSHPKAKAWFDGALAELKQELADWVDPQGGMAETPHYSMVVFDQWLGGFTIARNAGAADAGGLFDPRMRKAIEWFGNISTPRAPAGGFRRLPTVGHTYANERSSEFGVMACLWREKDPAFAGEMEWMHREHGSAPEPGILSYYPAFMGYRSFFRDSGVEPRKPAWGSRAYQETGVLLRNTIGSDRETTLYMIAGRFHSHYFNDSGSITIWGKGSELCDEDDYQKARNPVSREGHSMIDKPATYNEERVMELQEFSAAADLDYVNGVRMGWRRQIAFVKDTDPMAPNYFVLADTLDDKSVPTYWRLYLRAASIAPTANGVTVTGREDVDMDIIFVRPAGVQAVIRPDHIRVALEKPGTLTAVLYPRLRTEKPPVVTALADGRGVKVVTAAGTDTIYLDPEPVQAAVGGKPFTGKVCLLKERKGAARSVIPGACPIPRDFWPDGDRQLRQIKWVKGPQYPVFPDYEQAMLPNADQVLVVPRGKGAEVAEFVVPPASGSPRQATKVAVNWDDTALDVRFTCPDKDLVGVETGDDNIKLWRDDSVYVWLDPGHTHNPENKNVMIQLSSSGAWHDIRNGDAAFDVPGLKTEVQKTADGWTGRLSIPWQGLGVSAPAAGDVWGVNFTRMDQPGKVDHERMQMSSWVAIPMGSDPLTIGRWGHLVFVPAGDEAATEKGRQAVERRHDEVRQRAYSKPFLLSSP